MTSFDERWKQRRADFLGKVSSQVDEIAQLVERVVEQPDDHGTLTQVCKFFHKLAGSGGIYELTELCDLAISAESLCLRTLACGAPVSEHDVHQLQTYLGKLRALSSDSVGQPG